METHYNILRIQSPLLLLKFKYLNGKVIKKHYLYCNFHTRVFQRSKLKEKKKRKICINGKINRKFFIDEHDEWRTVENVISFKEQKRIK